VRNRSVNHSTSHLISDWIYFPMPQKRLACEAMRNLVSTRKLRQAVYVYGTTVALSMSHLLRGNTAMHSVCVVELHVAINCIKILSAGQ
jgi:hypothetical protein